LRVLEDEQERVVSSKERLAPNLRRMTEYVDQSFFVVDMLGKCGGQINRFYSNRVQAEPY
jgi:hypothetical protein